MSEIPPFFDEKSDFDYESFYYYLPNFNTEKKKIIGEKIIKYKGVNIIYLKIFFSQKFFNIVNKFFTKGEYKYFN